MIVVAAAAEPYCKQLQRMDQAHKESGWIAVAGDAQEDSAKIAAVVFDGAAAAGAANSVVHYGSYNKEAAAAAVAAETTVVVVDADEVAVVHVACPLVEHPNQQRPSPRQECPLE